MHLGLHCIVCIPFYETFAHHRYSLEHDACNQAMDKRALYLG